MAYQNPADYKPTGVPDVEKIIKPVKDGAIDAPEPNDAPLKCANCGQFIGPDHICP